MQGYVLVELSLQSCSTHTSLQTVLSRFYYDQVLLGSRESFDVVDGWAARAAYVQPTSNDMQTAAITAVTMPLGMLAQSLDRHDLFSGYDALSHLSTSLWSLCNA